MQSKIKGALEFFVMWTVITVVILNVGAVNATRLDNDLTSTANITRSPVTEPAPTIPLENSTIMNEAQSVLPITQTDNKSSTNLTRSSLSNNTEPGAATQIINGSDINATKSPLPSAIR